MKNGWGRGGRGLCLPGMTSGGICMELDKDFSIGFGGSFGVDLVLGGRDGGICLTVGAGGGGLDILVG